MAMGIADFSASAGPGEQELGNIAANAVPRTPARTLTSIQQRHARHAAQDPS